MGSAGTEKDDRSLFYWLSGKKMEFHRLWCPEDRLTTERWRRKYRNIIIPEFKQEATDGLDKGTDALFNVF
jgi:hypothetical protein